MEKGYSMEINHLPSKTWNWLKMNKSNIVLPNGPYETCESLFSIPDKEVIYNRNKIDVHIDSGMGEDVINFVEENNVKRDSFFVEANKVVKNPLKINLNYGRNKKYVNSFDVHAAENSDITVVMEYTSDYSSEGTAVTEVNLYAERNAKIKLVQVQLLGENYVHLNNVAGKAEEGSSIEVDQLFLGGKDRYSGCKVLLENDSSFDADICYVGKKDQKLDMNYVAEHRGKRSKSTIKADGVLYDNSFKLFRGTIDFKKGASGAIGTENENVILIGDDVRNQTIPLILCAEEDVQGNHGATIGKLDEEMLFYIASRGISLEEAYEMISKARIDTLCRKIPDKDMVSRIQEYITCTERKKEEYER